jgi:hypothetical protein
MDHVSLRAVAYKRDGMWMVQCIEHDIRARAYTIDEVPRAILQAFRERVALDQHLGKRPLEGVNPAPEAYAVMFQKAKNKKPHTENGSEILLSY